MKPSPASSRRSSRRSAPTTRWTRARCAATSSAGWQTPLTGLVVLGSNGEAPQLDDDEADRVVEIVARETVPAGRPLIAGTGRESTRATIAATARAAAAGVDAVLVRTPSFFKAQMTADVFVRHYTDGGRRVAGSGAALQRHDVHRREPAGGRGRAAGARTPTSSA